MARLDLFISYTGSDHAWAEWIAWQLKAAGYSVFLQAWHFRPGKNFILEMEEGMAKCDRTLIVLSPRYFTSGFTKAEWTAAFAKDPTGEKGLFIPVRIEKCDLPDLLAARIYIDLVGLDEDTTRRALIDGLRPTGEPTSEPHFPGSRPGGPAFPPTLPAVIHNLPFGSNPHFSGRSAEIKELHELLWSEPAFAELRVVAIHGLGGVGKTELALQFAWQAIHERAYGAVFWLKAGAGIQQRPPLPDD